MSFESLQSWYFGRWGDRIRHGNAGTEESATALPEGLGIAWIVVLIGWIRLGARSLAFWSFLLLVAAYVATYLLFPRLHKAHHYYQVENVILLAMAAAIVVGSLLSEPRRIEGYGILAIVIAGQFWTLYTGHYLQHLKNDVRQDPRYQAGLAIRTATPHDAVVVGLGADWASDLPYFANRRAVMIANWFPLGRVRRVVLDERERWCGGRKLGAVVDCSFVKREDTIKQPLIPFFS